MKEGEGMFYDEKLDRKEARIKEAIVFASLILYALLFFWLGTFMVKLETKVVYSKGYKAGAATIQLSEYWRGYKKGMLKKERGW